MLILDFKFSELVCGAFGWNEINISARCELCNNENQMEIVSTRFPCAITRVEISNEIPFFLDSPSINSVDHLLRSDDLISMPRVNSMCVLIES